MTFTTRFKKRLLGNWLMSFLSPLGGGGIAFQLPTEDPNLKIFLTAVISASIVAGIVLARELDKHG